VVVPIVPVRVLSETCVEVDACLLQLRQGGVGIEM